MSKISYIPRHQIKTVYPPVVVFKPFELPEIIIEFLLDLIACSSNIVGVRKEDRLRLPAFRFYDGFKPSYILEKNIVAICHFQVLQDGNYTV